MVGIDYSTTENRWLAFYGETPFYDGQIPGHQGNIVTWSEWPELLVCFLRDLGYNNQQIKLSDGALWAIIAAAPSNVKTIARNFLGV